MAASALVFCVYLINFVGGIAIGSFGNPLIQAVILMLLFANIRATVLSRRWMTQPVDPIDQELPERSMTTIADRFANKLPVTLWPKTRYVFFPLAGILVLLTLAGVVLMKRQAAAKTALQDAPTTLEIASQ